MKEKAPERKGNATAFGAIQLIPSESTKPL